MTKLTLTPQQQAVVENRGGSLLVSAAAGSGKTKVLVERLFRYVLEDHCNVDDFLIITYTKAAAAELRSKIASELAKRVAEQPHNSHLKRQMMRVYRADIGYGLPDPLGQTGPGLAPAAPSLKHQNRRPGPDGPEHHRGRRLPCRRRPPRPGPGQRG